MIESYERFHVKLLNELKCLLFFSRYIYLIDVYVFFLLLFLEGKGPPMIMMTIMAVFSQMRKWGKFIESYRYHGDNNGPGRKGKVPNPTQPNPTQPKTIFVHFPRNNGRERQMLPMSQSSSSFHWLFTTNQWLNRQLLANLNPND